MVKKIELDILTLIIIEGIFLLFFFKENWLTIILGIILGIILVTLTKKIPKNNVTKLILFFTSLGLGILSLYYTIAFINYNILKNFNILIIAIPFLFMAIYLSSKEYHTFIKSSEISFYIFLFIKLISLILIIPKINITNLPSIYNKSFNYHFILIGLTILYLYKSLDYLTDYRISLKKLLLSLINPLLIKLLAILVLGNTVFILYKYPYINYLKTIRYFDFIERVDGLLSIEYLISFFYLFTFTLIYIKNQIKKPMNWFNKSWYSPDRQKLEK